MPTPACEIRRTRWLAPPLTTPGSTPSRLRRPGYIVAAIDQDPASAGPTGDNHHASSPTITNEEHQ
jgi:hypothetical protein